MSTTSDIISIHSSKLTKFNWLGEEKQGESVGSNSLRFVERKEIHSLIGKSIFPAVDIEMQNNIFQLKLALCP